MPLTTDEQWISTSAATRRLGIARQTLDKRAGQLGIRRLELPGCAVKWSGRDIDRVIREHMRQPEPTPTA